MDQTKHKSPIGGCRNVIKLLSGTSAFSQRFALVRVIVDLSTDQHEPQNLWFTLVYLGDADNVSQSVNLILKVFIPATLLLF